MVLCRIIQTCLAIYAVIQKVLHRLYAARIETGGLPSGLAVSRND